MSVGEPAPNLGRIGPGGCPSRTYEKTRFWRARVSSVESRETNSQFAPKPGHSKKTARRRRRRLGQVGPAPKERPMIAALLGRAAESEDPRLVYLWRPFGIRMCVISSTLSMRDRLFFSKRHCGDASVVCQDAASRGVGRVGHHALQDGGAKRVRGPRRERASRAAGDERHYGRRDGLSASRTSRRRRRSPKSFQVRVRYENPREIDTSVGKTFSDSLFDDTPNSRKPPTSGTTLGTSAGQAVPCAPGTLSLEALTRAELVALAVSLRSATRRCGDLF